MGLHTNRPDNLCGIYGSIFCSNIRPISTDLRRFTSIYVRFKSDLRRFTSDLQKESNHNGFHNNGVAAEGRPPIVVEAAEGRLHYGGGRGGKHRKNICKYVSDIYVFVYLAYFNIFPLRDSWSYFISEIRMYDIHQGR